MTYTFRFTELGSAFARTRASTQAVEDAAKREIASMGVPDQDHLHGQIAFNVGDQLFVGIGYGDGVVMIDTATYEEGPILEAGPFKGKRVMIPRADSRDR